VKSLARAIRRIEKQPDGKLHEYALQLVRVYNARKAARKKTK
jgi:hypothetical protein